MNIRDKKHLLLYTAAFLGPLAVIRLLGGSVSTSVASSSTDVAPSGVAAIMAASSQRDQPLAPPQQKALEHARALRDAPFGEYPFIFTPAAQPVDEVESPCALTVQINAIMSSSSGPTALIDGSLVREGDAVADGQWVVESIDPDSRALVFREVETGRVVRRAVAPVADW